MQGNLTEELEKLAALRDSGKIPEDVFKDAKKNLLEGRPFVLQKNTPKSTTGSATLNTEIGYESKVAGMIKIFAFLGIIAGIALIIMSQNLEMPSRDISWPKEYLNGDAYNYQIEASIRAGEIAGVMIAEAIYLTGGLILCLGSSMALGFSKLAVKD